MIAFLRKHWISLGLLAVCTCIGAASIIRQTPVDIWRIEYEYRSEDKLKLPKIALADTVFRYHGIVCRNYTSSIADTLNLDSIRRHELKVCLESPSKERVFGIGKDVFPMDEITVINQRYRETQRSTRALLSWILIGFFLGLIAEFSFTLKKNPRSSKKHQ